MWLKKKVLLSFLFLALVLVIATTRVRIKSLIITDQQILQTLEDGKEKPYVEYATSHQVIENRATGSWYNIKQVRKCKNNIDEKTNKELNYAESDWKENDNYFFVEKWDDEKKKRIRRIVKCKALSDFEWLTAKRIETPGQWGINSETRFYDGDAQQDIGSFNTVPVTTESIKELGLLLPFIDETYVVDTVIKDKGSMFLFTVYSVSTYTHDLYRCDRAVLNERTFKIVKDTGSVSVGKRKIIRSLDLIPECPTGFLKWLF